MKADRKATRGGVEDKPSNSILGTFTGKCCDSNIFNNNDMHLSREVFETLMDSEEYKRAMENRHYIGFLGHPEDSDCQDDQNACIVMTDMKLKDDGEIEGTFDLVNTPVGQIVKAFIDAGVKYGISIRGLGEVDMNGEVDPDQFIFRGFDLVRFPAYDDCIPEFKAIAASTDAKKQAQYKKICASIDANLKYIKSSEALGLIQEELPDGSEEFNKVQDRIDELTIEIPATDDDVALEVADEKLKAVTELYLDAAEAVRNLEAELVEKQLSNQELVIECKTLKQKQARLDKIVANQIDSANESVADYQQKNREAIRRVRKVTASNNQLKEELESTQSQLREAKHSCREQIRANKELQDELDSLNQQRKEDLHSIRASEDLNLKYKQKIEANSEAISQKDSAIEELKAELDETVVKCQELESKASNLDEKNGELLSRVEAAEEMVSSYQQAYANIYANALGVYLPGLSITVDTSVEELTDMIKAGTSTANIAASPSYISGDELEEEIDDAEDDILGDADYSASLVTL